MTYIRHTTCDNIFVNICESAGGMFDMGARAQNLTCGAEADLFFRNGAIYTVDAEDRVVDSLAVRGGKILFAGPDGEGKALVGERTKVVDLEGKLMMPGFFDTHIHTPGALMTYLYDFTLIEDFDLETMMRTIRDYVDANPEREYYMGFGFSTNFFDGEEAGKGPRKERLDEICSDKAIAIFANDGHTLWLNTKAFEEIEITRDTPVPTGGVIEKDDETGELWGTLKDMAMALAGGLEFSSRKMIPALRKYQLLLNSLGFTSILSVPAFGNISNVPWRELDELDRADELTLRIKGAVIVNNTDDPDAKLDELLEMKRRHQSEFLKMTTAKIFADGVINTRTAYMLDPYRDLPSSHGFPLWEQDKLNEICARINAAGIQVHAHGIGDAGIRQLLDAYEYAREKVPNADMRNMITHLQVIHPDDIPRFGTLGVVPAVQSYWHYKQPDYWEREERAAIGEKAETMYPLKSLADAGAIVSCASDSPVTVYPDPFVAIQIGVTRNIAGTEEFGLPPITDPDDPQCLLAPGERMSVREMIRGFTANGAYATFSENETGTLEPGKAADLVIVDNNILECDPLEIERTEVQETYLNGRLIYRRSDYDDEHDWLNMKDKATQAVLDLLAVRSRRGL